jgi:riboflavin biosynthesis pyrimidine reductase
MQIADWRFRFEALEARKTAEALAARIAPFTTDVEPAGPGMAAIGNAWSRHLFDGPFYLTEAASDDLPSTSLVFVQSREGNTVARDPSTLGGGDADKHLIYEGLSRVAADGILGGQSTIRHGDLILSVWHPELADLRAAMGLPRHPVQIVATLNGVDLENGLMFNLPGLRVVLMTVARGAEAMRDALGARPWITPIVMDHPLDLAHAFRRLRQSGVQRLSCIGGRTIAEQLIDAGLVRDVYLTTAIKSAGEPGTPYYSKPLEGREIVRKRGTGRDTGVVFQHLALARHT